MLRFRKIMSTSIAATMLITSMGFGAVAENPDEAVYTFINEYGNTEVITQAQLDAEHWNKNALGDVIPGIYETFPMKMTGFANDFGELSLELKYMKVLSDMDNVTFKITNLANDNVIYNETVTAPMFYSPALVIGGQYEVVLTEIVDGETTEYKRVVFAEKTTADMPEYVTNPTADNEEIILIADVDRLRAGYTVDENGKISIDSSVATYDKVKACDFTTYRNNLNTEKIYRVFANEDNVTYSGYISGFDSTDIYDLEISVHTWEDMYAVSPISAPSDITVDDVIANATEISLNDASFRLRETSNSRKYAAFRLSIPAQYTYDVDGDGEKEKGIFRVVIRGSSKIQTRIWRDTGTVKFDKEPCSQDNENIVSFNVYLTDNTEYDYYDILVMVYFVDAVEGYGYISLEAPTNYEGNNINDVTGSIYQAYNNETRYLLENTEYIMNDGWDVDAFAMEYPAVHQVTIKNRSLAEQSDLMNGIPCMGSGAKYLQFWAISTSSDFIHWSESTIYTIAENADVTVYNNVPTTQEWVFTVRSTAPSSTTANKYQLSFTPIIPNN